MPRVHFATAEPFFLCVGLLLWFDFRHWEGVWRAVQAFVGILLMVGHLGLSFKAPFSLLKQLSLLLLSLTGTSTPALEEPPLKVDYLFECN